jgi:transcription elongation factor Elf1
MQISNIMKEKYPNVIAKYRINKTTNEREPIYRNWKDSSISVILNNKAYIGIYEQRKRLKDKETVEILGKIPPIISKEVFYECQENVKKNSRNYSRSKQYLFMQKLKCPKCGRILACNGTRKNTTKKAYLYYKCKDCDIYIREEHIEKELIRLLAEYLELYLILEENYYPIDSDLVEDFNNCRIDNKIRFAIDNRIINDIQNKIDIQNLWSIWELASYETKCNFIYEYIDFIEIKKYKVHNQKYPKVKITNLQLKPHKIKELLELRDKNMLDDMYVGEHSNFTISEVRNEEQAYQYINLLKKKHNIEVLEYVKGQEYYDDEKTFKVINIRARRAIEKNKSIFISLAK